MKKQLIAWLLILACLLSACGGKTKPVQAPAMNAEIPEKQDKTDSAPVEPEPEPEPDPEPEPEPEREKVMLAQAEALDETGVLFYVPNACIESGYENVYVFGETLLACDYRYNGTSTDTYLAKIDLYTGELLQETVLAETETNEIQICGDRILLYAHATGGVTVLGEELETEAEFCVADEWCNFYVNDAIDTAYCFTIDEGLRIVDLASGDETVILEEARSLFPSEPCGSMVSFSYVDVNTQRSCYATLNLAEGEIEAVPFADAAYQVSRAEDVWLCGMAGTENTYLLGTATEVGVAELQGLPMLLAEQKQVLISDYEEDGSRTCTLYDEKGAFLSSYRQDNGWGYYVGDPTWSALYGGYFFVAIDEEGAVRLLFWDLSAETAGEDLALRAYEESGMPAAGDAVSPALYERAAELSARYGVIIRIAEQCDTEYSDYTVAQCFDAQQISYGLDQLETALSAYPDGFFEQLCYGDYRWIEINLMGELTRRDADAGSGGFTSFTAFVEQKGNCHIMVFDLAAIDPIEQTCYHEFSHIIDEKLFFDAQYRAESNYAEETWAAFNPAGFDYAYSYTDLPDHFYYDGYDSYFIDLYSRTFPTEDRARLLEYAMSGYTWAIGEGTPLREKLAYYAACIRDTFDTTGWESVTAWEQPLSGS